MLGQVVIPREPLRRAGGAVQVKAIPPWKMPRRLSPPDILALVREILDSQEPAAMRWLQAAWKAQGTLITEGAIRAALTAGRIPDDVVEGIRASYRALVDQKIREALGTASRRAGEAVAGVVGLRLAPGTGSVIQRRADRLAVELTTQQRDALDLLIRYYTTTAPAPAGTVAAEVRRFIGLTSREAQAVLNMRDRLVAEGAGEAQVTRAVTTYTSRLRVARAQRIARTELAFATSEGQREAIRQAQREGLVGADVMREWSAADDEVTCPVCGDLDGQQAPLGARFDGGVDDPPAHPNCRCVVVYIDLVPKE